jgi:predicted small lipoprotein YifL
MRIGRNDESLSAISLTAVIAIMWLTGCGGKAPLTTPLAPTAPSAPQQDNGPIRFSAVPTFVSPETASHQGYATDGEFHYTIDTAAIYKRLNNAVWSVTTVNVSPFAGAAATLNHLGDGEYYAGRLLVPAERWSDCSSNDAQSILVFDSQSLRAVRSHDVSAQHHEVSALTVKEETQEVYVSSYCDSRRLFKYSLNTLSFIGTLELSRPVSLIQGLAYRDGYIYASSDATKGIYAVNALSGSVEQVLSLDFGVGNYEGLAFRGTELQWLIDLGGSRRNVYSFTAAH